MSFESQLRLCTASHLPHVFIYEELPFFHLRLYPERLDCHRKDEPHWIAASNQITSRQWNERHPELLPAHLHHPAEAFRYY